MTFDVDEHPAQPLGWSTIGEREFTDLVAGRTHRLLALARHLVAHRPHSPPLTRPLVADLLSQAAQVEELLDAYGARTNRQWSRFRSLTATIKLFTSVGYEILHIQHSLPCYRLLPSGRDFGAATAQSLALTHAILTRAAKWILTQALRLGLPPLGRPLNPLLDYAEPLPPGRLPSDRPVRRVKSTSETVTHLATAYLNLATEGELLDVVNRIEPADYTRCFPDPISEDGLRHLKVGFHRLQSLYDTHVSETEIEYLDANLPTLRGHVSVIFHLLEIATYLVHYYERHLNVRTGDSSLRRKPVIAADALLDMLMSYSITYAGLYLDLGRRLCHAMLKHYAEIGVIEVSAPNYRGFHVRPATLVAKIVQHYGSEVRMELDGQSYDASSPLDLFRANEKINARKRRWLVAKIGRMPLPEGELSAFQVRAVIMNTLFRLAEQGTLVIYQQPLQLSEEFGGEGILLEKVTTEIARLQATGQIDIRTDLGITFTGDKRVLGDLKLLAESGYGEDCFGNNITLPREIAYLRR
ncbi:MAG: HPr family phosphocarrier protein [Candidatus Contendobacter sp.]|nr:HPr family phosphocarrier protein [Candidatus Contendobacter sp.]MDS4060212.1 HPr family phosphocarrier protein [Candidatus Contendobacter sp.]